MERGAKRPPMGGHSPVAGDWDAGGDPHPLRSLHCPHSVFIHTSETPHFSSPSETPIWLLNPQELGIPGQERKRDVPSCSVGLFLENHGPQMVAEMPGK